MQIEKLKTERLIPAEYNPRKDLKPGDPEYEKLKCSIEQFGYVEPVIWNKITSHVVGAPTFAYEVVRYNIDKNGILRGDDNPELVAVFRDYMTSRLLQKNTTLHFRKQNLCKRIFKFLTKPLLVLIHFISNNPIYDKTYNFGAIGIYK